MVFIIQHYLIKKVSLFNLYVIRVGLNNAAASRILVNRYLNFYFILGLRVNQRLYPTLG